jgi:uncharacterized protein YggE
MYEFTGGPSMIRKCSFIPVSLILILFIYASTYAQEKPEVPTLDVAGKGVIKAQPNEATITLSVETTEKKASDALKKNAANTKSLIDSLQESFKEQTTITTSSFSVYPVYEKSLEMDERTHRANPIAYRINNSVIVKTSRIDDVGSLIDKAISAGANRIGSLSFGRSDMELLQKQAASRALENAMEHAEELARVAGLSIKRILYIQYAPGGSLYNYPETTFAEQRISTPISPGEITLESFVNVTFELNQ